jgi:uncharacterized damage-inducible protein DinB
MRRTALLLAAIASPLFAQQQQSAPAANVSVNAAKSIWQISSGFVVRSAEQMPESLFNFRPTPAVRSFGQIVAHVADAQYMFCSAALGEKAPVTGSFEKDATTKAAIVKAIKDATAYCERAYAQNDAQSADAITLFGQMQTTRLGSLIMNAAHDYEHYGNLVTYFRLKGMTPPSSQGM